jgi:hypothetical protein
LPELEWMPPLTGEEMPPDVRNYILGLLKSARKAMRSRARRGRGQSERERNDVIRDAADLLALAGYKPRRSDAAHKVDGGVDSGTMSASCIIAEALSRMGIKMKERAVEDIFRKPRKPRSRKSRPGR